MKHLFFLGIAGHAMGGLALAAQQRGYVVTGLDEGGGPPMSEWLDDQNINWSKTYDPQQLQGVDTIVISGHHGGHDHPVIKLAHERSLRIVSFAELLGELTQGKHVIAVAGTHGKTTTTSLIIWFLESAGQKPDYLVGIRPFNFEASSRLAGSDVTVIEADEYKASVLDPRPKFDYYHPNVLVLTSIEHDHPDTFPSLQQYSQAFIKLVSTLPKSGRVIVCAEDKLAVQVAGHAEVKVTSYGLEYGDYTAQNIVCAPEGITFDVCAAGAIAGRLSVPLFGQHNVLNALAATVVALNEGLSFAQIKSAATKFRGVQRRFNILTPSASGITVIDDYAHHPTEVKATIAAAKAHFADRRLVVMYRPHTYSRTQTLLKEYYQAFSQADTLFMADVEPAREHINQRTVSGSEIIEGLPEPIRSHAVFEPDRHTLLQRIQQEVHSGDVVLCMTVSGYDDFANELAAKLKV